MQVIFLPGGSGPSRNFRLRFMLVCIVVAGVLLAIGSGGVYLGYKIGHRVAGGEPQDIQAAPSGETLAAGRASEMTIHPPNVASRERANQQGVDKSAAVDAGQLMALKAAIEEQRQTLSESRRRLGDHIDSLGQRLGHIQAHVSRLNALGQRLTDMANLDPDEFSFDTLPAVGGPERPGPWGRIPEPELTEILDLVDISLREKENELQVLEALLTDRELHEKQYPQGWPTSGGGWMSSGYGQRTDPFTGRKAFHEGVDIAVRSGSEISAMAAGVVSFAGSKPGYGLVIEINHGNGYETRYAHARELIAAVGDRVEKGDPVARVGSTGRSTGSHVHIEVLKNGKTVSPHEHLNASG